MPFAQSEMRKVMKSRLPHWMEAAYYVAAASNTPIVGTDIGPSIRNEIFHRLVKEFRPQSARRRA